MGPKIGYTTSPVTADVGVPGSLLEVSWKVSRFCLLCSLKLGRSAKHKTRTPHAPHCSPPLPSSPRLLHRRPPPLSPSCRRSLHRPQRCLILGRQILLIWRQRLVRSWVFLGSSSSLGKLHHNPSLVVLAIPSGTVNAGEVTDVSESSLLTGSGPGSLGPNYSISSHISPHGQTPP